jgi:hypothetical protein
MQHNTTTAAFPAPLLESTSNPLVLRLEVTVRLLLDEKEVSRCSRAGGREETNRGEELGVEVVDTNCEKERKGRVGSARVGREGEKQSSAKRTVCGGRRGQYLRR